MRGAGQGTGMRLSPTTVWIPLLGLLAGVWGLAFGIHVPGPCWRMKSSLYEYGHILIFT